MNVDQLVRETYLEYLRSGETVELPKFPRREEDLSFVWASSLGMCPLAATLNRLKAEPKFPQSDYEAMSSLHMMRQGKKDAEPLQEAFLWKFGERAKVEHKVEDRELAIRGDIDILFHHTPDEKHIFEIKRRDAQKGQRIPIPKITDCLQLMAYGQIVGTPHMHIVIVNRYFVNTWSLLPEGDGYRLVGDQEWSHKHNTPEYMNLNTLREEVARQKRYLDGARNIPMPDFMNDEAGWLCYEIVDYPKAGIGGKIKRRCVHFCHTDVPGPYPYEIIDGRKEVVLPLPF